MKINKKPAFAASICLGVAVFLIFLPGPNTPTVALGIGTAFTVCLRNIFAAIDAEN